MCLLLGVTFLDSKTEIQLLSSYQFTFGAPVCSDKASMDLWVALVLLTSLYMHLIYIPVDSENKTG